MDVYIEREQKTLKKKFSGKAKELLRELKLNSDGVLVVCNGELVTEEDELKDSDQVTILSVISGG